MRSKGRSVCWQYQIRQENLIDDLHEACIGLDTVETLQAKDFEFKCFNDDPLYFKRIKNFIERHEWLGKMPQRSTHRFVAMYGDRIAGVVVMATPNAFSNICGKDNRSYEKLISRGACISWAPINLNSWLLMKSINWMVKNTEFRVFSGYSDTEAGELGTIYQACNFIYLGKKSGARVQCYDPARPEKGWFSDREFRKLGAYKRYAKKLNIIWESSWNTKGVIHWSLIPNDIEKVLRKASKDHQVSCKVRKLPKKHKYIYIKGRSKKETRRLRNTFLKHNPKLIQENGDLGLKYPKTRGL